jgi:hypothetical protein
MKSFSVVACEAHGVFRVLDGDRSLLSYCARALNSANLFAVSVTMSILRCSLPCSSGMFTLSVTRYALPTRST